MMPLFGCAAKLSMARTSSIASRKGIGTVRTPRVVAVVSIEEMKTPNDSPRLLPRLLRYPAADASALSRDASRSSTSKAEKNGAGFTGRTPSSVVTPRTTPFSLAPFFGIPAVPRC